MTYNQSCEEKLRQIIGVLESYDDDRKQIWDINVIVGRIEVKKETTVEKPPEPKYDIVGPDGKPLLKVLPGKEPSGWGCD